MSIHQEHYGRKFYQDKKTGYWISTDYSKENPRIRAHQWIWIKFHKSIPKGYHVHHINGDKSDNRIDNLELIRAARHLSFHGHERMKDPLIKKKAQEHCEKIRFLTKEWHASEEGRNWHKAHGIMTWLQRESFKIICKICNKECETKTYHQEFCSNACKSRWRRQSGIDNIERKCQICNANFLINRYSKTKTCNLSCSAKLRWEERNLSEVTNRVLTT